MRRHRVEKHGRAVLQGLRLFDDFTRNHGVVVADADGQVLAQAIQVFVALFVPQVVVLALAENQRLLVRHEGALRGRVVAVAPLDDSVGIPVDFEFVLVVIEL